MTKKYALEKRIKEAQEAYYNSEPIISDNEYDALFDELRTLDPENILLKNVGAIPDSRLQKKKHKILMGSLNKCNSKEAFLKWAEKVETFEFLMQPKLDGISIELVYKNGKLIEAITRGDGKTGEDITHNIKLMHNVKKHLNNFSGSLRGEIILRKSDFEKYFVGESNPRNVASGLARRKETSEKVKNLWVIYFDCLCEETFETEYDKLSFIDRKLKLQPAPYTQLTKERAIKKFEKWNEKRKSLDYEIDGMVFKINNIKKQEALGSKNMRPVGQIAWKFAAEMGETIVTKIAWKIGKTGRITPVIHVEPVSVAGVTIKKISFYTAGNYVDSNIGIGSRVLISRRNDVIPAIEEVLSKGRKEDAPSLCPGCSFFLSWEGEFLTCKNTACVAFGDIQKWIQVIEIEECGPEFVQDVWNEEFVQDPADLYTLTKDMLLTLPGYKERKATKIINNINKQKKFSFSQFFGALNIPNISIQTFKSLEKIGINTIENLYNASLEEFIKAEGVGEKTAKALLAGIKSKKALVSKLQKNGIEIENKNTGKLQGKSFCFTGEISIKRSDAQKLVKQMGGEVKSGVSKALTYLVQSDKNSTSGKTKKAQKYGTKIIDEDEFMNIVEFDIEKLM